MESGLWTPPRPTSATRCSTTRSYHAAVQRAEDRPAAPGRGLLCRAQGFLLENGCKRTAARVARSLQCDGRPRRADGAVARLPAQPPHGPRRRHVRAAAATPSSTRTTPHRTSVTAVQRIVVARAGGGDGGRNRRHEPQLLPARDRAPNCGTSSSPACCSRGRASSAATANGWTPPGVDIRVSHALELIGGERRGRLEGQEGEGEGAVRGGPWEIIQILITPIGGGTL